MLRRVQNLFAESKSSGKGARPVRVGLALGSGVARGWHHIGLLREFDAAGLKPDVIAGTSIGALVGGFYAAGKLDDLESFARAMNRGRMLSLLDFSLRGGALFSGARLRSRLENHLRGLDIEALPIPFAAVTTEIATGHEVWVSKGSLCRAMNASYALPGLLEPVAIDDRMLVDGALVNPVPVSVVRAMGADVVVAVNLVSDTMFRGTAIGDRQVGEGAARAIEQKVQREGDASWFGGIKGRLTRRNDAGHSLAQVMLDAFSITQDRIARSRLAGDPPDVLINARLEQFGLFDFHRAPEMIELGREVARRRLPDILEHIEAARAGALQH
ncbi:MAG: patatin-like phospholipase family protein [Hyphomicrobiales bacterium]|nr:patatin-like phospholipase family protein [Hyphomicrobiales bacterium]